MAFTHALFAKREQSSNDTNQRPPKPELTWQGCDWCACSGWIDGERCANCDGVGGWWIVDAADPNVETAGAWWLNALALIGLIVLTVAG